MTLHRLERNGVLPCPAELLIRREFGAGFDAFVRSTEAVRLVPGIYVQESVWRDLPPWQKYLTKVHAVQRKRPDAVFVLESAAALIGLPVLGSPMHVHILAEHKGGARITGLIQGHHCTDELVPVRTAGIAHTSPADTAVDIARRRHPAYAKAVLDQAIRVCGLTAAQLAAVNDDRDSARGHAAALWAIERARAESESVLESISAAAIEWLGFEMPQLQVEFDLGPLGRARVDTFWPTVNVIGEADGDAKYRDDSGGTGAALVREKKREDALRRQVDGFARWGWSACRHPDQLDETLGKAGVPRARPRDNTRLRTLAALLRA